MSTVSPSSDPTTPPHSNMLAKTAAAPCGMICPIDRSTPNRRHGLDESLHRPACGLPRRGVSSTAAAALVAASSFSTASTPALEQPLRLELPTADVQKGLSFGALRAGQSTVVVVQSVSSGGAAEAAGVRPGQRLLELSDPIRTAETWPLGEGASLRYVRDAIRMRLTSTIFLTLSPQPHPEWRGAGRAAAAAADGSAGLPSSTNDTSSADEDQGSSASEGLLDAIVSAATAASTSEHEDGGGGGSTQLGRPMTIAEKLEAQHRAQAQQADAAGAGQATALKKRIQRRQNYMEEVGKRNDAPFFAGLAAMFVLPALAILAAAASSGYLDQLAAGTVQRF